MLERLMRMVRGNHCRLQVWRGRVCAVRHEGARRLARARVHASLTDCFNTAPDELSASISAALGDINCRGLAVRATIGDDLVRYFMVTPPANCTSMLDLRSATDMRFQGLYGESVAPWHVMGDWRPSEPFLACAVPREVIDALRFAVDAQRATLVSVRPAFIEAWNRLRRDLSAGAWLVTLDGVTSTLGIIVGATRPRLAAIRLLALEGDYPSPSRLCEQVGYAALLEGVQPPTSLHIQGALPDALQQQAMPTIDGAIVVHWHSTGDATSDRQEAHVPSIERLAQPGAVT